MSANGATQESVYQIIEREFACSHPKTEIRRKVDSLNRNLFVKQCLICGQAASSALPHAAIPQKDRVEWFDEDLEQDWRERRNGRYKDLASERYDGDRIRRAAEYAVYLESQKWHAKRYRVLNRDGYKCQACLERRATHVHHLTYDHIFNEPLFDLVSVCEDCHKEIHAGDNGEEGRWTT